MITTNNRKLPKFVEDFNTHFMWKKEYTVDKYSVTELLKAPREYWLTRRHYSELKEDLTDVWAALIGTMLHAAVEQMVEGEHVAYPLGTEVEKKVQTKLPYGITVSGKIDLSSKTSLTDWKFGAASSLFGFPHPEWEEQLNVYRLLYYMETQILVDNLFVNAAAPDWRPNEWNKTDFPAKQFVIPVWDIPEAKEFLTERVQKFALNEDFSDNSLDYCTTFADVGEKNECWEKPPVFAVHRNKNKTASKLFKIMEETEMYIKDRADFTYDTFKIVCRPGVRTKCDRFCRASHLCNQYEEWKNGE